MFETNAKYYNEQVKVKKAFPLTPVLSVIFDKLIILYKWTSRLLLWLLITLKIKILGRSLPLKNIKSLLVLWSYFKARTQEQIMPSTELKVIKMRDYQHQFQKMRDYQHQFQKDISQRLEEIKNEVAKKPKI